MPSIMEGWYLSSSTDEVLALGGQCTIDPSPSPPSTLEEIFKYGGLRNSCSIFVLVFYYVMQKVGRKLTFNPIIALWGRWVVFRTWIKPKTLLTGCTF